ncbi:MAG: TIGR03557 family F420-dependent LLM class oxidoreductase [Thaumarchaeota archaeon]|nr:TIGR03557 family F420-dependent LLM class oxidoreductase [Nitrososphaerota archaeon]
MSSTNVEFGYLGINEVHPPQEMLKLAVDAERYGFDTIWLSDHFHPWSNAGTSCNFAWTMMAAALERTGKARVGPGVTVPGARYNPAVLAQASATLGATYPGRFFLGIGSGEPINEMAVGSDWPRAGKRLEKFDEALEVIRLLFDGKFVDFTGKYFNLRTANLYTKPSQPVPMIVSASGPKSARIAGKWGDGIILPTGTEAPVEQLKNIILPAFRAGAEETGRDSRRMHAAVHISVAYDEDEDKILSTREYWNHTVIPNLMNEAVSDPRINEAKGKLIDVSTFKTHWIVATSPDEHIKRLEPFMKLGIDELVILSTSPDEEKFLRVYGTKVLPYLRETYGNR